MPLPHLRGEVLLFPIIKCRLCGVIKQSERDAYEINRDEIADTVREAVKLSGEIVHTCGGADTADGRRGVCDVVGAQVEDYTEETMRKYGLTMGED